MRKMILQCGALALGLLAANVMAAVTPEEANKLGTSLTPLRRGEGRQCRRLDSGVDRRNSEKRRGGRQQGIPGRSIRQ